MHLSHPFPLLFYLRRWTPSPSPPPPPHPCLAQLLFHSSSKPPGDPDPDPDPTLSACGGGSARSAPSPTSTPTPTPTPTPTTTRPSASSTGSAYAATAPTAPTSPPLRASIPLPFVHFISLSPTMAGSSSQSKPPRTRKRVEAETGTLKRARDGSAFTRCEGCNKDVPVVLIDMHSCSLDSKIRMSLEALAEPKKSSEKKRVASSIPMERKGKKEKKMTNTNKPKCPLTAFFYDTNHCIFMDDFRKSYKDANPGSKGGTLVAKEGGAKWKSMTEELEAAQEREKELIQEVTDLQLRLICVQDELQRLRARTAQF